MLALLVLLLLPTIPVSVSAKSKPQTPNILFIIMDDVGIDQMELFGFGGVDTQKDGRVPQLPSIETIASEGVAFGNAWSMPACSTSRAVFFTGRYPLRTNVLGALGPADLANGQLSPYETSLPILLHERGYTSGIFGKYHLGLQGNSPFNNAMPSALGWDYFYGWLDVTGDPHSIDTTAGGVAAEGTYSCGFVPAFNENTPEGLNGADFGACYTAKGKCENLALSGPNDGMPPGRVCRDSGGILDPSMSCKNKMPANIKTGFNNLSGHYVSPLVINDKHGTVTNVPLTDIRARTYRGSSHIDGAIDWIKRQPKSTPWMASVSFASAHTPAMQPPQALINTLPGPTSSLSCVTKDDDHPVKVGVTQRELTTLMIEAMDAEIARLLVSLDLADYNDDGSLDYSAAESNNTMIVILGDNGTLGTVVKLPFDPTRAKGTAYQTGVWVPLIVAGAMVNGTNRSVSSMVNIADLYQLFGEVAGIEDVHAAVPRKLDSVTMLPYLSDPDAATQRKLNFTQVGPNEQAGGTINGACVIAGGCTQIPVTPGVCTDNGGTWYGEGTTVEGLAPEGLEFCCQVNQFLYTQAVSAIGTPACDPLNTDYDETVCTPTYVSLSPLTSMAIRNSDFKVVRNRFIGDPSPAPYDKDTMPSCDDLNPPPPDEFYSISEDPDNLRLDRKVNELVQLHDPLPLKLQVIYDQLRGDLDAILNSEQPCPIVGTAWTLDGNLDGVIDEQDLIDLSMFAELTNGGSSWYDVNLDGYTKVNDDDGADANDYAIVQARLGLNCAPQ